MKQNQSKLQLILKGAAMGVAEVIPGVSGGTIAFITGIYETLINSIKAFGPEALQGWKVGGVKGMWAAINGDFLLWLLAGMIGGIGCGIFGVTYLLEHYPEPLWAFFFGLILASAVYISRQVSRWQVSTVLALVIGAVVAYLLTSLSPATGSLHPLYVFVSGAIAISALMLPGISGSFILLIMGMYTIIVPLLKDTLRSFDASGLGTIIIFSLGCLTGLVVFSRVLSWLFAKYQDVTIAMLTGFLIGALNKVWPWRNVTSILDKDTNTIHQIGQIADLQRFGTDQLKVLSESNVLPSDYWGLSPMVGICAAAAVLGLIMVLGLARLEQSK